MRVIELKVDEAALLGRIEKRAKDMLAAGCAVRADDNPEAFKTRLDAYRAMTAPVSAYYAQEGGSRPLTEWPRSTRSRRRSTGRRKAPPEGEARISRGRNRASCRKAVFSP